MTDEKSRERPGNTPVEQQERDPDQTPRTRPDRRAISGPGAADFVASTGGEDLPGFGPDKGMSKTRGESPLTERGKLAPRTSPDSGTHPGERAVDEENPGSATGRIGGGGADAHNPSPVRATGADDPSVSRDRDSD